MRAAQNLRTTTRKATARKTTAVHEPLRKPPRPRDYWIFDQVVRRSRSQEDVAEDVRLTPESVSQICIVVGVWMDRIWDESLPEVEEEEHRMYAYLIRLRIRAQDEGRVPPDEDVKTTVARWLCELEALPDEMPGAN